LSTFCCAYHKSFRISGGFVTATPGFSLEDQGEVFFSSTAISRQVRAELRAGRVRHVGGRLYTKNVEEPLRDVVRRRMWDVILRLPSEL
jgi:hypothetical protein